MLKLGREALPLKTTDGRILSLNHTAIQPLKDELESFLSGEEQLNSK